MRENPDIPTIEFHVNFISKTATDVTLRFVEENRQVTVPLKYIDDAYRVDGKLFVCIYRRVVAAVATRLADRLGVQEKADLLSDTQRDASGTVDLGN